MIESDNQEYASPETEVTRRKIEELRQQFQAIDQDETGMIQAWELASALKKLNLNLDDAQINSIVKEVDYVGNGMINYSEFLAAALSFD